MARFRVYDNSTTGLVIVASETTEQTFTTSADAVTFSSLSIAATAPIFITGVAKMTGTAGSNDALNLGVKLNATTILAGSSSGLGTGTLANDTQGRFEIFIPPRVAGYLRAGTAQWWLSNGAVAVESSQEVMLAAADAPTATITDIAIIGECTGGATGAFDEVHLYTLGTSA